MSDPDDWLLGQITARPPFPDIPVSVEEAHRDRTCLRYSPTSGDVLRIQRIDDALFRRSEGASPGSAAR